MVKRTWEQQTISSYFKMQWTHQAFDCIFISLSGDYHAALSANFKMLQMQQSVLYHENSWVTYNSGKGNIILLSKYKEYRFIKGIPLY